ncbi:MAG: FtsQ-type POTRA domain-containing protein [Clostridia bacterium]|nr:FtsQ-type POTRA domain-containing protein [Clostridia bacterium]
MKQLTPEQVAKLRPESRQRYEARLKAVKRNRRILTIFCTVLVALLVVVVLSTTVLFNITNIKVAKTGAIYSANEIISASGLNNGDNMVRTDFDKVCERIEKNLPYVLEAIVTKKLSGEVTISIKDTTAAIFIEASQGYAVADINGKVLEILEEVPEEANFMVIRTSNALEAVPGEIFSFADEEEKALYDELVKQLKTLGIFENITAIDISDRSSIKLEYQNRLRLLLGSVDELEVKLKGGLETIKAEDSKDPTTVAEINLTIPKKVFVNPLDSLNEEKVESDTKDTTATDEDTTDVSADTSTNEDVNTTELSTEADEENSNDE